MAPAGRVLRRAGNMANNKAESSKILIAALGASAGGLEALESFFISGQLNKKLGLKVKSSKSGGKVYLLHQTLTRRSIQTR
jgi:chemotaxis response regulator CheB